MFSNVALCKVQEWPQIFFHVNMFTYTWYFKNKTSCSIQWTKHYVTEFQRFFLPPINKHLHQVGGLFWNHDWSWCFFFHWYIYFLFLAVAAEFSSQNRTKGSYFLGLEHLGVGRGLRNFSVHMGSQIWRSILFGNDGYDCINTWKPNFFAICNDIWQMKELNLLGFILPYAFHFNSELVDFNSTSTRLSETPVSSGADDWTEYFSGKYWAGGGIAHSCPQAVSTNLVFEDWKLWCQYLVSTPPSWQVQPLWHCSASLLESWELLRRNLVSLFLIAVRDAFIERYVFGHCWPWCWFRFWFWLWLCLWQKWKVSCNLYTCGGFQHDWNQ